MSCSSVAANNESCRFRSLGRPDDSTYASFVQPVQDYYSSLETPKNPNRSTENHILFRWWLGELKSYSRFNSGVPQRASITGLGGSEKYKVEGEAVYTRSGFIKYLEIFS
jgi:hypothetical protein